MAGRKPLPTALKELRGNPGKRALNHAEPKLQPASPRCPAWLSEEARREWRRVVRELGATGMLTRVDRAALAAYCDAWARWIEASKIIDEEGLVLVSEKGQSYRNPALKIVNDSRNDLVRYCSEFGMTPSSRSRIKVEPPAKEPSLAEMLFEASK